MKMETFFLGYPPGGPLGLPLESHGKSLLRMQYYSLETTSDSRVMASGLGRAETSLESITTEATFAY